MKNSTIIVFSLMLFVPVLIGVSLVEPVAKQYEFLQPFIPMVVITGFFTFLVAAALFIYGIISWLKK